MLVTQIQPFDKKRCKVFLDGEFAFVLYNGECRKYGIREGEELSDEIHGTIMGEILLKRARLRAMNLLQKRDYTENKLREKLRSGLYPEPVIDEAIAYVESFHYVDDYRYANDFIRCNGSKLSFRQLEQKLMQRGVSEDTIRKAWKEWEETGGVCSEEEIVRRLLHKRGFDALTADAVSKQKECAYLLRKGFAWETIRSAMRNMDE